jgi:hypothetical protein
VAQKSKLFTSEAAAQGWATRTAAERIAKLA